MWELVLLAEHVHPSVAAMTRTLLAGVAVEYAGDPMRDMSTSAFLDKFVQKKPKVGLPALFDCGGGFQNSSVGTLQILQLE